MALSSSTLKWYFFNFTYFVEFVIKKYIFIYCHQIIQPIGKLYKAGEILLRV